MIWIMGQFSTSPEESKKSFDLILENVGNIPFEIQKTKSGGETKEE